MHFVFHLVMMCSWTLTILLFDGCLQDIISYFYTSSNFLNNTCNFWLNAQCIFISLFFYTFIMLFSHFLHVTNTGVALTNWPLHPRHFLPQIRIKQLHRYYIKLQPNPIPPILFHKHFHINQSIIYALWKSFVLSLLTNDTSMLIIFRCRM